MTGTQSTPLAGPPWNALGGNKGAAGGTGTGGVAGNVGTGTASGTGVNQSDGT